MSLSFLGMVNYMGRGVHPQPLTSHTEPPRAVLKRDNVFHWDQQVNWSFQQIKVLILKAHETPLRYYDRMLLVTV